MNRQRGRKIISIFIVSVLTITSLYSSVEACTGFCVYGKNTLYGMNFDYQDTELKFLIQSRNGINIFHLYFSTGTQFIGTAGINDRGLVSTLQFQYPLNYNPNPKQSDQKYIWEMYNHALENYETIAEVDNYLNSFRLIQTSYNSIHTLIGAKDSNAAIYEAGTERNMITRLEHNYIVMSNFCHSEYAGIPPAEINDVGADRYRIARAHIEETINEYDVDNAIETLRRSAQYSGDFPTQCSMVFSPNTNEVFIMIKRNFEQIWKLSLDTKTIETFRGFSFHQSFQVNSSGILSSALMEIETSVGQSDKVPADYELFQNYPNPFNPSTKISYSLKERGNVKLEVFDIVGQCIKTLVNNYQPVGKYEVVWNSRDKANRPVCSGMYIYRLQINNKTINKKMLLVK